MIDGAAFYLTPWFNSGNTIGGLDVGASFWLFRISISLDATWSTAAPKTAPTVGLSVDLITTFTVSPSLISLLPALGAFHNHWFVKSRNLSDKFQNVV